MRINAKLIFSGILFIVLFCGCGQGAKEPSEQDQQGKTPQSKPKVPGRDGRITLAGSREIPYKLSKQYEYLFQNQNGEVGKGGFTIEKTDNGGYKIRSTVEINDTVAEDQTTGAGVLMLDSEFNPISYERSAFGSYKTNPGATGMEDILASCSGGIITMEVAGPGEGVLNNYTLELPQGGFVFDNNYLGQMAFICSQPELKSGRAETLKVLSVNLHQLLTIRMTPKIKTELTFEGGRKVLAYEVDMKADDQTFGRYFVTPEGVLLKAEEMGGMMLIELLNPDLDETAENPQ